MQKRKLHPALKALLAVAITVAVLTGAVFGVLFATSLRPEAYGFDPDWIIGRSKQEIIAHYGGDEKNRCHPVSAQLRVVLKRLDNALGV